jgi:hypothetical protein
MRASLYELTPLRHEHDCKTVTAYFASLHSLFRSLLADLIANDAARRRTANRR